jgi:hypothetical protein
MIVCVRLAVREQDGARALHGDEVREADGEGQLLPDLPQRGLLLQAPPGAQAA